MEEFSPSTLAVLQNPTDIERDGNGWYPLPPDYDSLTDDGQRLARVNACCQSRTPSDFVSSWVFFRANYLEPTPRGFFYKDFRPSPPAHYQMVRDIAEYARNIHLAPRGAAKSTVLAREIPMLLAITRPYDVGLLVFASGKLRDKNMGVLKAQLEENELLIKDFGRLKPPRSKARRWAFDELCLIHGASIEGATVDGRKRGARPDWIIMDDPEYDPDTPGKETELRQKLESLLFQQLLPMLDQPHKIFEWVGTFVSRKAALYAAAHGTDPRFQKHWNRRIYASSFEDEQGNKVYFWPSKWDAQYLEVQREALGDRAFEAEMQNNPVSDETRVFCLDKRLDTYDLEIGGRVDWVLGSGTSTSMSYDEWWGQLGVVFTVDLLHQRGLSSDFSSILVTGIDHAQDWWVLDLFMGRVEGDRLMAEVSRLGSVWKPDVIGIESVAGQVYFQQWLDAQNKDGKLPWSPRCIWPVKYPYKLSKEARICALAPRAQAHRIRLPLSKLSKWPLAELWRQLEMFTPDGLSLDHDDALDSLAMIPFCPRPTRHGLVLPEKSRTVFELLESGEIRDPKTGLPLAAAIDFSSIPEDILQKFLAARDKADYHSRDIPRTSSMMRDGGRMAGPFSAKRVRF